jgi:GNAT superfamily N-acetyltransferase
MGSSSATPHSIRSLTAQLAADRQARLVQEADAARLFAPRSTKQPVVDVSRLQIRVLEPGDADAIGALLRGLSARARYLRFMSPIHSVSTGAVRHLAAVDHERHEAAGAFDDGILVGAAHSYRSAEDPTRAEVAAEVSDAYQGNGIGTRLLRELATLARRRGISHFRAGVLHENTGALALIRGAGWPTATSIHGAELTIELAIGGTDVDSDPRPAPARLRGPRSAHLADMAG